jgi:hypothetical protein
MPMCFLTVKPTSVSVVDVCIMLCKELRVMAVRPERSADESMNGRLMNQ